MSAFFKPVHAVLLQLCDAPYELVVRPEINTKDVKIGGRYFLHDGREARVLTWLNDYQDGGANGLIATLQRLEVQDDTKQNTGGSKGYTNALDALGSVCTGVAHWVRNEVGQKAAEEIAKLEQRCAEEKAALESQLKTAREERDEFAKEAWELNDKLKKQLAAAKRLARKKRRAK